MHLPQLISDLALILLVASTASLICRILHQPVVLGYLGAGILVGPHFDLMPTVVETSDVKVWAELGIIFFLFHLGMEFSFKKLLQVGKPAAIAAITEVFGMIALGYVFGRLIGWSPMDAMFLGAILSISSTTIIIKAFEEVSAKTRRFSGMVYGILIIEDLMAILILVFLSTVAVTRTFEGKPLLIQSIKLGGFLVVVIPIGIYLLPRFLRTLRVYFNDETRVVFALGSCLGLAVLSSHAGFSAALGAFLMGAFFAETVDSDKIERFLNPIKYWFGAIFFTSVGMLVDVRQMAHQWDLILMITVLTILGKILTTTVGMLMSRQDRVVSLQTGLSLAQIGEFSFIIATLGLTLNVIRPDIYPLAVAVSLLTTFTTPYLIRLAVSRKFLLWGEEKKKIQKTTASIQRRIWDGHLVELEVHPHFTEVGKTLEELALRERFGINVVSIIRGERRLLAPTRQETVMAFDRLIVLGTETQLHSFEQFLRSQRFELADFDEAAFELRKHALNETSPFLGKELRQSGIRESISGMVLGIERPNARILNPPSTEILQVGDVLWLYGQREKIRTLE